MELIIMAPRVVQSFIAQFPETTNNAYKYFNYDNRVVDERAEHRFDVQSDFKGPEQLTDNDFNTIVSYAKTLINPILAKYNYRLACEDALHMAIRSYDRGIYDNKVNASKYSVLLNAMVNATQDKRFIVIPPTTPIISKEKKLEKSKKAPLKDRPIPKNILKRIVGDPSKIPLKSQIRKVRVEAPRIVKKPGIGIIIEK